MKTNSDPASYTEQLTRRFLDDGNTPSYDSLNWDERAGVLAEIIKADLNFGWEIIQQMGPLKEGDNDFPELLAGLLEARCEGKYAEVANFATSITAYLTTHSTHYGRQAINDALEDNEAYLRGRGKKDLMKMPAMREWRHR